MDAEQELRFLFSFLSRELKTLAEEATKVKSFNFLFFFCFVDFTIETLEGVAWSCMKL